MINRKRVNVIFLVLCIVLGLFAELAFLHGKIGISYPIFVAAFYSVFFWRFKHKPLTHRRLGILLFVCIWLLALRFVLFTNPLFYVLNSLLLPLLITVHLVLITSPKWLEWHRISFLQIILKRIGEALRYDIRCLVVARRKLKGKMNDTTYDVIRKVGLGLIIAVPILYIVISLLGSSDAQFAYLVGSIPAKLLTGNFAELSFRTLAVCIYTVVIFGFLQVLGRKNLTIKDSNSPIQSKRMDGVIILPILILLNSIYTLYTSVQFQYFFSGSLQEGFTYAEYARRGFFELLLVTLLNLSLIVMVLTTVKKVNKLQMFIRSLLTLLVFFSGVMLASAFIRLFLYEKAYGFTLDRVLPHSFMIFLAVIFGFTLMKIWMDKLSLFRFYIVAALVYYTLLNVVNIDSFIVEKNIARFENTGKIDIHYLDNLSYTGLDGLMNLYERNPNIPQLKQLLLERQSNERTFEESWQSYNFTQAKVVDRLDKLSFN